MSKLEIELLITKKGNLSDTFTLENVFGKEFCDKLCNDEYSIEKDGKEYIVNISNKAIRNALFLNISYQMKKAITQKEIVVFQGFGKSLSIEASKNHFYITTLKNDCVCYYTKRLTRYFSTYEWALRKFIYLIVSSNIQSDWVGTTLTNEIQGDIKKREQGSFKEENFLQYLTLFQIEEYLFEENSISVQLNNKETSVLKYKELSSEKLVSIIKGSKATVSQPYSLWSELFSKHSEMSSDEIRKDMKTIREARNSVMHNKEIDHLKYKTWIGTINKYVKEFNEISEQILYGTIEEDTLVTAYDDFKGYLQWESNLDLNLKNQLIENISPAITRMYQNNETIQKKWGESIGTLGATIANVNQIDENMKKQLSVGLNILAPITKIENWIGDTIQQQLSTNIGTLATTMANINRVDELVNKQLSGSLNALASVVRENQLGAH